MFEPKVREKPQYACILRFCLLFSLAPFAAAFCFSAPGNGGGNQEERNHGGNGGKRQGEIQRGICTFGFDRQPQIVHRLRRFDAKLLKRFAARRARGVQTPL